jgi:hypothetical protein
MEGQYLGTTERAAIIRKALKAQHKLSGRDVSVRAEHFSMGSSIEIKIKNPEVSVDAVKAIAEPHEKIDRDQFGEILGGGNRFLHIGYSSEARTALAARALPAVAAALEALQLEPGYLVPVTGSAFLLGAGHHGLRYGLSLWRDGGHMQEVTDAEEAAFYIAARA